MNPYETELHFHQKFTKDYTKVKKIAKTFKTLQTVQKHMHLRKVTQNLQIMLMFGSFYADFPSFLIITEAPLSA